MLWSTSTAWRCMHASTVPGRAGELFVRTLVQRSAQRLAADVAPSAARAPLHSRAFSQPALGREGGRRAATAPAQGA